MGQKLSKCFKPLSETTNEACFSSVPNPTATTTTAAVSNSNTPLPIDSQNEIINDKNSYDENENKSIEKEKVYQLEEDKNFVEYLQKLSEPELIQFIYKKLQDADKKYQTIPSKIRAPTSSRLMRIKKIAGWTGPDPDSHTKIMLCDIFRTLYMISENNRNDDHEDEEDIWNHFEKSVQSTYEKIVDDLNFTLISSIHGYTQGMYSVPVFIAEGLAKIDFIFGSVAQSNRPETMKSTSTISEPDYYAPNGQSNHIDNMNTNNRNCQNDNLQGHENNDDELRPSGQMFVIADVFMFDLRSLELDEIYFLSRAALCQCHYVSQQRSVVPEILACISLISQFPAQRQESSSLFMMTTLVNLRKNLRSVIAGTYRGQS